MSACVWDSGSMTGCRPVCDQPATRMVEHSVPCYGTFTYALCAAHARLAEGRYWPDPVDVQEISSNFFAQVY